MELNRCRRYYQTIVENGGGVQLIGSGYSYSSSEFHTSLYFNPVMRVSPTLEYASGSYYYVNEGTSGDVASSSLSQNISTKYTYLITVNGGTYQGAGTGGCLFANNSNAYIRFSSEL